MPDERDFFERIYALPGCVFGDRPAELVSLIPGLRSSGRVLDFGAGEGRNSLYLAACGFTVTAVDRSSAGAAKMRRLARERQLALDIVHGDLRTFGYPTTYDVGIIYVVLHLVSATEAPGIIAALQRHTNAGGLHVISVITKDGDFYRENSATGNYYPDPGAIRDCYAGWEILRYSQVLGAAVRRWPDGQRMRNLRDNLLARKIR